MGSGDPKYNPVKYIDPTGEYTLVQALEDGTYEVVGGSLEGDDVKDLGIYIVDENGEKTDNCIGESLTPFSFYNEDKQDGEDQVGWIGTVDVNSTESGDLIKGFKQEADEIGLKEYMKNATDGEKYDFKRDNDPKNNDRNFHHRGSVFRTKKDGTKVIATARDAGNFAAGYKAAKEGLPYSLARKGFDALEIVKSAVKGHLVSGEGRQSTYPQKMGYAHGKWGTNVGP